MNDKDTHILAEAYNRAKSKAQRGGNKAKSKSMSNKDEKRALKKKDRQERKRSMHDADFAPGRDEEMLGKKVTEAGEYTPSGELGALTQGGVEELEPEPKLERPMTTSIFEIFRKLKSGSVANKLGFHEMIDFYAKADGMVAVFEHEDGNLYEVTIKARR